MRYVVTSIDCIHFSNAEPGCAAINRVIQASSGIHKLLAIVTSDLHEKFLPWTWSIEPSVASSPWIDQSIDRSMKNVHVFGVPRLFAWSRCTASLPPCLVSHQTHAIIILHIITLVRGMAGYFYWRMILFIRSFRRTRRFNWFFRTWLLLKNDLSRGMKRNEQHKRRGYVLLCKSVADFSDNTHLYIVRLNWYWLWVTRWNLFP